MATTNTTDGVTIHYETIGNAGRNGDRRDVVLVHGITDSMKAWGPIPEMLGSTYRVTTIDLRGHGESSDAGEYSPLAMANDVGAVVGAVGMDRPLVIGHSLGGIVVTIFSMLGTVRGAVNVDQPLHVAGFQALLTELAPMLRDPASFLATYEMIVSALDGEVLSADIKVEIAAQRRPRQEVVMGVWNVVIDTPADDMDQLMRATAGAITAPYLALLFGEPSPEYDQWLTSLVPHAEVETWPRLGHYAHRIDPQRFVDRVIAFDNGG